MRFLAALNDSAFWQSTRLAQLGVATNIRAGYPAMGVLIVIVAIAGLRGFGIR